MPLIPVAGKTHNLTTSRAGNLFGWMVVPGTFRVSRANDFAPRISSGQPTHSDLDLWPTIDIEGFQNGLGQDFLRDDKLRFYDSDHELDTSIPGQVTLAAGWYDSDPSFVANAFCDFGNFTYAGGLSSVRKFDPAAAGGVGTWADSKTGLAAPVVAMKKCFNKLWVGIGNANAFWDFDGSATWTVHTGHNANCFEVFKALLHFGSAGNLISYDGVAAYTTVAAVGDPQSNIIGLKSSNGYLIIFKDDGRVYVWDSTSVIDFAEYAAYSGNFKNPVALDGWLYHNILSDVKRIAAIGSAPSIQRITPEMAQDRRYGWGIPVGFTDSPKYVYCLFDKAENSYPVMLKFNDTGWHVSYKGESGDTANACYYSLVSGALWVNDGSSRYQKLTTVNDTPYPAYPVSSPRSVYLCHVTAGFDDVKKTFRDIRVISEDLTAKIKLALYYQTERDGVWNFFGTVTRSPEQTVAFASGSCISATDLWIRIDLVTNDTIVTPKLKGLHITYQTRPETVYAIDATIRVDNSLELMDADSAGYKKETHTADELLVELMALSDAPLPVELVAMDGNTYQVMQTNITWKEEVRNHGFTSFEVPVRFLQAFAQSDVAIANVTRAGLSRWGVV